MKELKEIKFAFLSHEVEGATGFPAAFASYLQQAGSRLTYVRFPFFYSQTKSIWVEHYQGETLLKRRRSWIRFFEPQLLSFAKDMAWLLSVGWISIAGADFVLVTDNLLGLAALILRKLGIIKSFTYLVVDYSPKRFANPWIERLYVCLDTLVATHADSVWTMGLAMLEGRERDGRLKMSDVTYRLAPMGNNAQVIFSAGDIAFNKFDLVYVGNPNAKNVRADLLLEVARVLRERKVQFRLIFVGPGNTSALVERTNKLGLNDLVIFRGSIADPLDLERYLAGCGIGLAPYDPDLADNFSKYADPSKIKVYLGCGLPVVSTDVPAIAQTLQQAGAGAVAQFTAEDFADKITALWSQEQAFQQARTSAKNMGKEFSWPRIFDRLMHEEGLLKP